MDTCKAAVFVEVETPLEIQEFPIPTVEPRAALVRMEMAAVCATDVHAWHNPRTARPVIFGHENIGVIAQLGEGLSTDVLGRPVKEGDRVLFWRTSCGRCFHCSLGEPCQVTKSPGFIPFERPPYIRGGFSQYVYLDPNPWILRVPDEMSTERALMAVVGNHTMMHGIERVGGIDVADTVVVQGSGPIGMGALTQAKVAGAKRVIVIGAPAHRLRLAEEMGADETIDIGRYDEPQARVARVLELTGGRGADVVIECSGADTAVQEGLEMVRHGGKYLVVGQLTDYGPKPINPSLITRKALHIAGVSGATPRHIIRSLEALQYGLVKYPVEKLITHQFPLAQVNDAFRAHETLAAMVAVIRPNQ